MMIMPVMMVLFLVVAFLIIIPLIRYLGFGPPWMHGDQRHLPPSHSALDILDERFARGEIDKTEYEEKRRLIAAR